jgi:hypothetical protein
VLEKRLGEVLRAISDFEGYTFHELAVEQLLRGPVHALRAQERIPLQVLLAENALDVALGIAEPQGDIAEAEIACRKVVAEHAPHVDDNGVMLFADLGSDGHRPVLADRSAHAGR